MDINLSQMTMTLKATGAIESDGEEISLVFNNIALKYDQTNGGFSFSLPEATPVASDGNNYKVTDLNGSIAAYALSNSATSSMVTAITVLQISYTSTTNTTFSPRFRHRQARHRKSTTPTVLQRHRLRASLRLQQP